MSAKHLTILTGNDHYLLDRELQRWQQNFGEKYGTENIEILNESELQHIIINGQQTSLFSEKRLLICHDLLTTSSPDDLANFIENAQLIPKSTIILFIETNKFDKRKKTTKQIFKQFTVKEFMLPDSKNLNDWILKHSANHNKILPYKLANELNYGFANHTELLHNELLKIYTHNGPEKQINYEKAQAVISWPGSDSVFALTDSLSQSQKQSIPLLHKLHNQGEDLMRLFFLLSNHIRNLSLYHRTHGKVDGIKSLKLHPFVQKKLRQQSSSINQKKAEQLLKQCLQIDIKVKTGGIKISTTNQTQLLHELEKLCIIAS